MISIQAKSMSSLLSLILALSAILLASTNSAEARYLPTRADESDVEVLKDLIKGLIIQSNLEQLEARMVDRQQPQQTGRFYHQSSPQQQFQVERRSGEMPVGSDGDMLLRSAPDLNNSNSIKSVR